MKDYFLVIPKSMSLQNLLLNTGLLFLVGYLGLLQVEALENFTHTTLKTEFTLPSKLLPHLLKAAFLRPAEARSPGAP